MAAIGMFSVFGKRLRSETFTAHPKVDSMTGNMVAFGYEAKGFATDDVNVFEYTPQAVKLAVVGTGAAEKAQVAHMVRAVLSIEEALGLDASDALAVGLCHAQTRRLNLLVAQAVKAVQA